MPVLLHKHSKTVGVITKKKRTIGIAPTNTAMQLFTFSFGILQFCGFWRPVELSGYLKWFYYSYTSIMMFILYSVTLSQMIELLKLDDDLQQFIYHSSILLTTINACAKVMNICQKRSEILELISILSTEPCYPKNYEEEAIQRSCDKIIKRNSLIYAGVTELAVIIGLVCSIFRDLPQHHLTYKASLPYGHDTGITYCMTYIYQYGALVIGSLINISYDTLVSGCMLQTCVQLEIFKHRMKNLCRIQHESYWKYQSSVMDVKAVIQIMTRRVVAENIKHHIQIFRFAESANRIFAYTIFFQYSVSSIVICNGAHRLSSVVSFSPEFFTIIGYLMCMLMQILIFCYYGNVVTCKSTSICNEIYSMDWHLLNQSTKRSFLIIMARTFRPIKFGSGHIVVLSLRSFNKLMKLSYSVYNVLHQRI